MISLLLRIFTAVYLVCGALALLLIPASLSGWFGMAGDGLSGVWAILLSMPWSISLQFLPSLPIWMSWSLLALGIGVNGWLLLRLATWLSHCRSTSPHRRQ